MGCTSHCRSGLVEMAVTVGMKLALETARSVQKSWNKTKGERCVTEQVRDTGAACSREREEMHALDCSCLFICLSSWMEGLPFSSQRFHNAAPFCSILLLRSRYSFSITHLKGGLL